VGAAEGTRLRAREPARPNMLTAMRRAAVWMALSGCRHARHSPAAPSGTSPRLGAGLLLLPQLRLIDTLEKRIQQQDSPPK
jgi:hypothetical protein